MLQHYYSRSMVCGYSAGIGFDFREQNASRVFHCMDAGAHRLRRVCPSPCAGSYRTRRRNPQRCFADSDAKFVLRDDTNLSLGPGSTLKLDRAVFSGETSAGDIAVKLTSGAFRFVTGHSTKESYKIVTPLATIGVRGTTLDFLIQRGRNVVVLQDGQARVCAAGQCVDLLNPGDSAVITSTGGKIQINRVSTPPFTFASACAANSALCSQTTFAEATIPGTPEIDVDFASALCGK